MPSFTFSDSDIAQNNPLEATWYPLKVVAINSAPGKKDPSGTTTTIDFVVADGGPGEKTPIRHYLTDKMLSGVIAYVRAFVPTGKVEPGKAYNVDDTLNKMVMGYCTWDKDFKSNKVLDLKPMGK